MRNVVIVDGVRTAFFRAGSVPDLNARKLGVVPVKELARRYPGLEKLIDCVVGANIGNQLLPPDGSNIARLIALDAGIPQHVDARTININCGSGLEAIIDAAMRVEVGLAQCVLVIGVEVMSDYTAAYGRKQRDEFGKLLAISKKKSPMVFKGPRLIAQKAKTRFMAHEPEWLIKVGLTDPYCGLGMDKIADKLASEFQISRKELDLFALESQRRAYKAQKSGRLAEEIVSFQGLDQDNGVREGQMIEHLARLRPLNPGGTTTPGNSSQVSDGAVALIVADKEFVKAQGWPRLAGVSSELSAAAGCDPTVMGLGPVAAIRKLFSKMHAMDQAWDLNAFGVIETNEAFASVVLAQSRLLEKEGYGPLPWDRTNINGGAIAIGHPVGASGARLALTAAIELKRQKKELAIVTLCVGGGQGVAAVIENLD